VEKKEGLRRNRRNSRGNFARKERLTKSSRRKVVGKERMRGRIRWEGMKDAGERMGGKERLIGKDVGGMEGDRARREVGGKESARRRGSEREGYTEWELRGRWDGREGEIDGEGCREKNYKREVGEGESEG
jgi:hypothetical protein